MRKFFLVSAVLLLVACAPVDDTKEIVGTVLQTLTSADGKVLATLTQDDDLYRVYLQGKDPGQPLWKMLDTKQAHALKMEWHEYGDGHAGIMVHGVCGGTIHYPQGTGNNYPDPDKDHGIGIGFRCD